MIGTLARARIVRIAIADDRRHSEWARALESVAGVHLEVAPADSAELAVLLAHNDIDALVVTHAPGDAAALIANALDAGKHVLVAAPPLFTARQARALHRLAIERDRMLLFACGGIGDARLAFVRRMVAGVNALWRPRYLRLLDTGGERPLHEAACDDIAIVLSLMGARPATVSAVAPRVDDENGGPDTLMLALAYAAGPVARIDISGLEATPRREVVLACETRTVVVDALDERTPLQVLAVSRRAGPGGWRETVREYDGALSGSRTQALAELFVDAISRGNEGISNARLVIDAAEVWEAARSSAASGGQPIALDAEALDRRSAFHVIAGRATMASPRRTPALRVIRSSRGGDAA